MYSVSSAGTVADWRCQSVSEGASLQRCSSLRVGIAPKHPRGVLGGFLLHQTAAWPWKQKPWQPTWLMEKQRDVLLLLPPLLRQGAVCVYLWQNLHAVTHLTAYARVDIMALPCSDTHITQSFHQSLQWAVAAVNKALSVLLFNMRLQTSKHTI